MTVNVVTYPVDPSLTMMGMERVQGPCVRAGAVTNGVDFTYATASHSEYARALYVGSVGNISVKLIDGVDVQFLNCPTGLILPIWCRRVNASGTSATSLVWLS